MVGNVVVSEHSQMYLVLHVDVLGLKNDPLGQV